MTQTHQVPTAAPTISRLFERLMSEDGLARESARAAIVKLGSSAVPHLLELLNDEREFVRWEAAKALEGIADPSAASALVRTLEDRSISVRWLAASGLIALGTAGVPPLLKALVQNSGSIILLLSAHRVIFDLVGRDRLSLLKPVLDALESAEPPVTVPLAAQAALNNLRAR